MIAIVGAGAAGLAVARQLQRRKLETVLFEQGSTGHVWAEHYDGLKLHTLKQTSALPCLKMGDGLPTFPTGSQVRDYLVEYRLHFNLDVREGVDVHSARRTHESWELHTSAGEFRPDVVVAATGIWSKPWHPGFDGLADFPGNVVHSSDYENPKEFAGKRVLVIGAGNSGCEIAAGLGGIASAVSLSVRDPVLFVEHPSSAIQSTISAPVLRNIPPRAASWLIDKVRCDHSDIGLPPPQELSAESYPVVGNDLPNAVRAGTVEIASGVSSLSGEEALFDDGSTGLFDAIVLATGFRPALDWVDEAAIRFSDDGTPLVDRTWRSIVEPTLSCVGFEYPTTEGWLQALNRVSKRAAAGVAASINTK